MDLQTFEWYFDTSITGGGFFDSRQISDQVHLHDLQMIDDGKLKIYAHATVDETKQNWANSDFVELDKPDLIVTVSHCLSIFVYVCQNLVNIFPFLWSL